MIEGCHELFDVRRTHEWTSALGRKLGLVDAVRDHVRNLGTGSVRFEVRAPTTPAPLSPAIELAAYRVALEAMTNVVRHARASRCWIGIDQDDELAITVEDDGVGVADEMTPGVGIRSMRDRVLELGGCGRRPRA